MSDLLERLAAANPVPDAEPPTIDDVWRKVAELDPPSRPRQRARPRWLPGGTARMIFTLGAALLPIIVVVVVASPLHGPRHRLSRPTSRQMRGGGTSLDPAAQRIAARALAGRAGSVVVLDPRTGAIKAMLADPEPGGDPLSGIAAARIPYPPEAAFDIVTAAAALDSGRYSPRSRVGPTTLGQALSLSINRVFATVGETVGRGTMTTYMKRFGFYSSHQLAPSSEPVPASGALVGDKLTLPTSARVDLGRLAAGQGTLIATPLQMAMVAAAVANHGKLLDPQLETKTPKLYAQVMDPLTAEALTQMMREVVIGGTGTAADLAVLQIAGKTGTAHVGGPHSITTDQWFIGFAPANHPKIAIAVVLTDVHGGYGGTEAAPIAARVIQQLLGTHTAHR